MANLPSRTTQKHMVMGSLQSIYDEIIGFSNLFQRICNGITRNNIPIRKKVKIARTAFRIRKTDENCPPRILEVVASSYFGKSGLQIGPIDLLSPSTQKESNDRSTLLQVRKKAKGAIDLLISPTSITMTRFINLFFLKLVIQLWLRLHRKYKIPFTKGIISKMAQQYAGPF